MQSDVADELMGVISMQCVNFRECGGNVTLLPGHRQIQGGQAEIIGNTCPCTYSDSDVSWFDDQIVRGRAHP